MQMSCPHFLKEQVVLQLAPYVLSVMPRTHRVSTVFLEVSCTVMSDLSSVHTPVWSTIPIFGFTEQRNCILN